MKFWHAFSNLYKSDLQISSEKLEEAYQTLQFSISLQEAVSEADLLIEAIPESIGIKKDFTEIYPKSPPKKPFLSPIPPNSCRVY